MPATVGREQRASGRERSAGTPENHAADSRARILEAALTVFAARGYRGGSLNDVAAMAGLTRAGLLHHYPSKEALLLSLLEKRDADLRLALKNVAGHRPTTVRELIALAVEVYRPFAADRQLIQLAHILTAEASGADHPAHTWVSRRYSWLLGELTSQVESCITAGALPARTDPRTVAALLLGAVEGLENVWLVEPSNPAPLQALEHLLDLLPAT
jgi:AcrR family transcriptional regulator